MTKNSKRLPYFAALGTVVLWASAFPAVKYTLEYYSPESLMLVRFIAASAFLLLYCIAKKIKPPALRDLPLFALSGFAGLFVYMWAFNTGTNLVASGVSSFIITTAPVFTLILSIFFLREKATPSIWIGVIVSFGGIALISATQVTDMQLNHGIWLLLIASISAAAYNILLKFILRKYAPFQATAYTIISGTIFMFIFTPNMLREFPQVPLSGHVVILYLGLFPAAIAYLLWGYALSKAAKTIYVTSFSYLSPFLASLIAFIWLGETLSPMIFIGGGSIAISGMIMINIRKIKES